MIKRTVLLSVITFCIAVFYAAPAQARHCPKDVRTIDAALAKPSSLSSDTVAEVMKLRDYGKELHNSGSHAASLDALHQAMRLLGINH